MLQGPSHQLLLWICVPAAEHVNMVCDPLSRKQLLQQHSTGGFKASFASIIADRMRVTMIVWPRTIKIISYLYQFVHWHWHHTTDAP
jgi:hypothetical protein